LTVNPDYSIVWYNSSKNFVYFGDCVGATSTSGNDRLAYPAYYNADGVSKPKLYGYEVNNNSVNQYVYNSTLEMNAVAYLIKKAAISGINPH
jgi:hypothetical protein